MCCKTTVEPAEEFNPENIEGILRNNFATTICMTIVSQNHIEIIGDEQALIITAGISLLLHKEQVIQS